MENEQITVIENTEEENGNEKKQKQKKWLKRMLFVLLILLLLLFSFFLLRREETKVYIREYEEHVERLWETKEDVENPRINIAVSQRYEINDENPLFYIGYPEDNVFDIVLTFYDKADNILYETKYIQPGTNVAIDGTTFVLKDTEEYRCNISAYDRDTGKLMSSSVNVIMKIRYQ